MSSISPQPNLDACEDKSLWSFRFWVMVAVAGASAGIVGGLMMRLLYTVEHFTWRYHSGTLFEAASHASSSRRILALLTAGVVVGVGGRSIRKAFGQPGELDSAIWFRFGRVPVLATMAAALNSIVAVGLGTSLGREAPIKQAGGALASQIARWSGLTDAETKVLVACGVGAGMAAAYNVPVGGALFAIEVLLGSISLRMALPAIWCAAVATAASWVFLPPEPIYHVPEFLLSIQLTVWALLMGPILGLATVPWIRAIGWAGEHKPKGTIAGLITPIILLTLLGLLSIAFPQLLGNGKDGVETAFLDQITIPLLLVLPCLKLLATVGCLRAGASGGLFTPTMFIGALLGGLFGHAWDHFWPGASMGACAVVGSCAFLAAASEGPISAMVMVLELTRHVDATMVPTLLAVTGATLTARRIETRSIYTIRVKAKV
jgi:CIC family chloride channel protein